MTGAYHKILLLWSTESGWNGRDM